ncbi:hypothetical protein OF83DRAFT_1168331 [Amylostereum chailletii]|nr:hypothetical protein OF83DRAFT_1168331 [Amylostereum chailletii]
MLSTYGTPSSPVDFLKDHWEAYNGYMIRQRNESPQCFDVWTWKKSESPDTSDIYGTILLTYQLTVLDGESNTQAGEGRRKPEDRDRQNAIRPFEHIGIPLDDDDGTMPNTFSICPFSRPVDYFDAIAIIRAAGAKSLMTTQMPRSWVEHARDGLLAFTNRKEPYATHEVDRDYFMPTSTHQYQYSVAKY